MYVLGNDIIIKRKPIHPHLDILFQFPIKVNSVRRQTAEDSSVRKHNLLIVTVYIITKQYKRHVFVIYCLGYNIIDLALKTN